MLPTSADVIAVDEVAEKKAIQALGGNEALIEEARQATQAELHLSFWQSVK